MEIYKIKNKKTGLYSRGGHHYSEVFQFSKTGKIWKRKSDLSNHLTMVGPKHYSEDCIIEVLQVEEIPVEELTIEEYYTSVKERREKANAARELRYQQYKADLELKKLAELQSKYAKAPSNHLPKTY